MNGERKETVGLIAGTLTTGAFIPQVYTIWRHAPKPAPEVSLSMYVITSIGIFFWLLYGAKIRSFSLICFNILTLILVLAVLTYKLMYG